MANPQTPVIVGVAQVLQRTDDLDAAKEPIDLMLEAVRAAAEDAGSAELLNRAGSVRVVRGIWKYEDPGRYVAEQVGCGGAQTAITPFGGNFVQTTVNRTCLDIQSGAQDIVLVVGAECGRTAARIKKEGRAFPWRETPGKPDLEIGQEVAMAHEAEMVRGIPRAHPDVPDLRQRASLRARRIDRGAPAPHQRALGELQRRRIREPERVDP